MFEYLFGCITVVVSLQLFSESTLFVESTVESPFVPEHYRKAITKHNASCFLSKFFSIQHSKYNFLELALSRLKNNLVYTLSGV